MASTITPKDIEKIVAEALDQPTKEAKKSALAQLGINLQKIAEQIRQQETKIMDYDSEIRRYTSQGMSRASAITQAYKEGRIDAVISEEEQKLMDLILNGYLAVEKVRSALTGETIDYQIGAGSKKTGKVIEATMSYEELAPFFKIEYKSEGYSIRIRVSQKMVKTVLQKQHSEIQENVNEVVNFTPGASSLYSSVFRYYTDTRLNHGTGTVGNWGNFYEAYRLLLAKSDRGNLWVPSADSIAEAFREVLSGGGKSGSFAAGGDVLSTQVKAAFGSSPTLTSSQSVVNALYDLKSALDQYIETSSADALVGMLTRAQGGEAIFESARQEAEDSIRQLLEGFTK